MGTNSWGKHKKTSRHSSSEQTWLQVRPLEDDFPFDKWSCAPASGGVCFESRYPSRAACLGKPKGHPWLFCLGWDSIADAGNQQGKRVSLAFRIMSRVQVKSGVHFFYLASLWGSFALTHLAPWFLVDHPPPRVRLARACGTCR